MAINFLNKELMQLYARASALEINIQYFFPLLKINLCGISILSKLPKKKINSEISLGIRNLLPFRLGDNKTGNMRNTENGKQ